MTDADTQEDHSHYPYVRRAHVGWSRDSLGHWTSETTHESQWEIVCPQCGDSDGPLDAQSDFVRALRGPYSSRRKARRAAKKHARHNQEPSRPWEFPTGDFPQKL